MPPLVLVARTSLDSIASRRIGPFTVSASIAPEAREMRMPPFPAYASMRPFASATVTCPCTDLRLTRPVPPVTEIAFVVGTRARYVEEKDAMAHIAGQATRPSRRSSQVPPQIELRKLTALPSASLRKTSIHDSHVCCPLPR